MHVYTSAVLLFPSLHCCGATAKSIVCAEHKRNQFLRFAWRMPKPSSDVINKSESHLCHCNPGNDGGSYCWLMPHHEKIKFVIFPPAPALSLYPCSRKPKPSLRLGSSLALFSPRSHWHLLTDSLFLLPTHLFPCQKSILQGPGRQRVKAFHYSSSRDQPEEHTTRTSLAIVSVYKCTDRGRKALENGENQCFHLNRIGRYAEGAATPQTFSFPSDSCKSFDVSCSKWFSGPFLKIHHTIGSTGAK